MKNLKNCILTIATLLFIVASAHAQEETTKMDTTVIITNGKDTTMVIKNRDEDDDIFDDDNDGLTIRIGKDDDKDANIRFSLLDLGVSTYLYDGGFGIPEQFETFEQDFNVSLNINWHIFRHRLPIAKKKLGLEYGVTLSWNDYKFDDAFEIVPGQNSFETIPIDRDIKKNKLKTTHLEVPIMLTWVPGKRQSYFVSAGVYGGLLIGSKQKIKYENNDKLKVKDDFNLNKTRVGVEARVGLGAISFYGRYSFTPLFQDGTEGAPELTPINIGITLLGF